MMKKLVVVVLLSLWSLLTMAQRTINLHYLPNMSQSQAESYIGYDAIVVDPETPFSSSGALDQLLAENPDLKIISYINFPEWFNPMFPDKPWSKKVVDFLNQVPEWWLRISFWPGMQTMNCSADCPRVMVNGKKYNYIEFMTEIYIENILKKYQKFSGSLLDNCWEKIFWLGHYGKNQSGVDINGDGRADDSARVDKSWRKGMEYALNKIKEFGGSGFIIIANPGSAPFSVSTMFEDFPLIYANEEDKTYQGWYENMNLAAIRSGVNKLVIFNSRKDNYFFTLCSSMLLDNIYFAYVQNSKYDRKWQLNLGRALGAAEISGEEHCRRYENGVVYVDPRTQSARVVYTDGTVRNK